MAISVKDIQEKDFSTQLSGGYNIEQVDDFLDEISEQLGALIRENLALTGQLSKLSEELSAKEAALQEANAKLPDYNEAGYFRNLESAMRESLIGAQRVADETIGDAQRQAEQILADAKAEAESTVTKAREEAEALTASAVAESEETKAEYEKLKTAAETYRASFRKLIEEQLQTLKANDILFK